MPWYPSAKACPAAIKPTVQCFFPTLYQVLLFDFSSFGEKLFFCLRGYAAQSREARCKNSRSAERGCSSAHPPPNRRRMGGGSNLAPHQQAMPRNRAKRGAKTAGAQSEDVPLFTRRRTGGEWVEIATLPHHQQAMPRNRAKRGAKTAGAQSAAPAGAFRSATAAGGTWRGDRMFLCSPAAEQAANGWRRQPGLTAGGSSKPRTTANKLSPRRAKLALNVRIGRSCRAHNHHKFSHRILQPHTKRRASHAD